MKPFLYTLLIGLLLAGCNSSGTTTAPALEQVVIATNRGNITVELYTEEAPITVENFLRYTDDGFYNGLIFHRVIDDFVIQGGGFDLSLSQVQTRNPILNEADNGLSNLRGTIAMARAPQPHSATSQFYINVADNQFLDHTEPTQDGWGYAVFGRVVAGMDVVDAIAEVETGTLQNMQFVPVQPVYIQSVSRVE